MILYIGNKLSSLGKTPTTIEILGPLLAKHYPLTTISNKKNKFLLIGHIIYTIVLKHRKLELVLIDTYSTSAFYFAVASGFLCRALRVPYISILHGGNLITRLRRTNLVSARFFKNSACLVAPSSFQLEIFRSFGYSNLRLIPNVIPLANYPFLGRNRPKCRILWVRSFHKMYNPIMALEVLTILKKDFQDAVMCMVGPDKDGSLHQCKEFAQQAGVEDDVTFTGLLSKPQWHELSKDFDVFINTTTVDNMPLSVIEAMALGLIVVSTNVGGLSHFLEHEKDAYLVNNGDAHDMARQIKKALLETDLTQNVVVNARNKVTHFDWPIVEPSWLKTINENRRTCQN